MLGSRSSIARSVLWLCFVPALRLRALARIRRLQPDEATIVTVNWNSAAHLEVLLRLVQRRSPPGTRVLVVDNGSREDPRPLVADRPGVSLLRVPFNVGHDMALDIGFLSVRTEYVVALDVDAFPIDDRWLEELLAPLREGCEVAGARLNRRYVHPCCLAMRTGRFVERKHSFRSRYRPREEGRDASGDVGEEISGREPGKLRFLNPTSQRGPGDVGTVFGDVVYHNFYSTRFQATTDPLLDGQVSREDPAAAWREAVARYDT